MTPEPRILAGYDGSEEARHAVAWAAQDAVRRRWPLVLVGVHEYTPMVTGRVGVPTTPAAVDASTEPGPYLTEHAEELRATHPDLTVHTDTSSGRPADHFVERSAEPGLVVLGTRRLSGIKASLLGGVADDVVTRARGPVCIVPDADAGMENGPVVVGVDDDESSRAAVDFALDEARAAGVPVVLFHCLDIGRNLPAMTALTAEPKALSPELEGTSETLDAIVADVRRRAGDVEVSGRLGVGSPGHLLVNASSEALMVVVGSRGRGGLTGMLLGSTSREVLRDTHAPAVVVPPA